MLSRREFVKLGAMVGGGAMLPLGMADKVYGFSLGGQPQPLPANPLLLTKYLDPLPVMPAMPDDAGTISPTATAYAVGAYEFFSRVHSQMPPTKVWGYRPTGFDPSTTDPLFGGVPASTFLGPSFVIKRGTQTSVHWSNNLAASHPMPVDPSLHWANPLNASHQASYPVDPVTGISTFDYTLGEVPLVPHVHGGEQAPFVDGGPDAWWTASGKKGPAWFRADGTSDPNMSDTYLYHNAQPPATIWYHDHALGITRLNVYMGLAGAYLIVDPGNEPAGLPSGAYDVPLVIQDRMFASDPATGLSNGQLYYPAVSNNPTINPFWIPEFFGDHILVNGVAWPKMDVEPRKYRFRVLNGSNARFYELYLWDELAQMTGPALVQIASDGGYLGTPATLDPAIGQKLVVAPGERAEVVIDFAAYAGKTLVLRNTGRSPYPKGATINPQTTGQVMAFVVGATPVTDPSTVPIVLNSNLATFPSIDVVNVDPVVKVRSLTLNEWMGVGGPLMATLNNTKWPHMGMAPETEDPALNSTEVWEIINLTGDTHPIHLHLVQFQLISRQNFNFAKYWKAYVAAFGGMDPSMMEPMGPPAGYTTFAKNLNYPMATGITPYTRALSLGAAGPAVTAKPVVGGNPDVARFLQGPALWAPPEERGWKDTVKMHPVQVTRILVRWKPIDGSGGYPFDPKAEPGYVWHCHILDHEDNEMMRPYHVK